METIYISEKYFTTEELKAFKEQHNYDLKEIKYSTTNGEIDFSKQEEKEFLFKYGVPKILARFGY